MERRASSEGGSGPVLYFDVCCLNRPFDDLSQQRVRDEADAVLTIVFRALDGSWSWLCSDAVESEVARTSNARRRERVQALMALASGIIEIDERIERRGEELQALGLDPADALHVACAEAGGVDVFLTTDVRLERRARRVAAQLSVTVINPLTWLQEMERR